MGVHRGGHWEALISAIPATSQDSLVLATCDEWGKCVPESRCDLLKGNKGTSISGGTGVKLFWGFCCLSSPTSTPTGEENRGHTVHWEGPGLLAVSGIHMSCQLDSGSYATSGTVFPLLSINEVIKRRPFANYKVLCL